MDNNKEPLTPELALVVDKVIDYTENMFKDGHNRTHANLKIHDADRYDEAVKTPDAELSAPPEVEELQQRADSVLHSRDGTDSSGEYDETGGPIGGTEAELDALEANFAPVDRTPHMKD